MTHRIDPICAVYIISNPSRSIYVGATTDLKRRIFEHKTKHFADSHSARYSIDRLVWWQECDGWADAHIIELKLKNMHRSQKIALIGENNPRWLDLSYGLFGWSSSRFRKLTE